MNIDCLPHQVLFGAPHDAARYQRVLEACALEADLAALPSGDATEIGERGVTLSGGQKARVSLARALYADADVYLLDDVLSAVDAHVGRHLVDQALGATLVANGRTVLLASHQLSVIDRADRVLILRDGHVACDGTPAACRASEAFAAIRGEHDSEADLSMGAVPRWTATPEVGLVYVKEGAPAAPADGGQAGVSLTAGVTDARVIDATDPRRFHPLAATGQARLAGERWTGAFDLSGAGAALGRLMLNHDGRTGAGGLTITTPQIVFAEPGLQPSDLTPLLDDFVQSPVTGSAGFEGRVDWTKDAEPTSSGRLTIPGLDFTSPAGPVEGLKGDIVLTSLTPLVTAPDQRLTIDRLDTATDATGLDLTFALDATALNVAGARVAAAGGFVSIEPFAIPLDPTQPFSGVVVLDRVQLGQVVSDSGFGDKVQLDALVSGRLPFTSDLRTGFKVTGGSLVAVEPGRLSIKREVLAEVDAGGGGDVPPSMVEDLAYQAMENLAFDVLTAEVNSRDDDRMAVLFHIRGRHDPPQKQELRLTLGDLISRRFLNRNLPLPSNTGIDLTLDTTLNLNQLIGDLLAVNRARQGEAEKATQP